MNSVTISVTRKLYNNNLNKFKKITYSPRGYDGNNNNVSLKQSLLKVTVIKM
jgi:hypothetical protein